MKGVWRILGGLLTLLVLVGVAACIYAWRVLPRTEGELVLQGPRAQVRIERDANGIPTIHAASRDDAVFGLGFVHAQDRLWQLELHRRTGSGRLSEAFGEAALESDRFLRALGVRRAAAEQWKTVSPSSRAAVEAYTAGINAFIAQAMQARPPEFVVLGLPVEPWTPQDSLAWATMMAWDLAGNWSNELLRMRLSLKLPVSRIDELLPPYAGDKPLVTTDYAAIYRELKVDGQVVQAALGGAPESGVEGVGSNNWALAGSHTDTGKPMLANDPHLKLSAPALWYFARFDAPGFKLAGATMPGLPIVVLGQNEHIAWGFTNTGPDVQDMYLERIQPGDATRYQTPDGWAAFETVNEVIRVKGGADVPVTWRRTRHGPVISDANPTSTRGLTGPVAQPGYVLAMRWNALDADCDPVDTGLAFADAKSVQEFLDASARHVAPMQNMAVADRDGRIGWVAAGRVPLRKPDNDLKGHVPAPGWDARYDWAGWLEPTQTPRELDPPRGWLATANQRVHAPDYPHFISSEWQPAFRQQRIEQLIEARPKHTLADLRAIQADQQSPAATALLAWLRKAQSGHPLANEAQRELADFEGAMAADRAAPLIYWAWYRQLVQGVFSDEMGAPVFQRALGNRSFRDAIEGVLARNDTWWCDDKGTPAAESCQQQIDLALTRALDELSSRYGSDIAMWQWGRVHQARSEHRPFSHTALAPLFELRVPVGGDTYTVNAARVALRPDARTGESFLDEHGPSLRALYDLSDPNKSRVMHSSGQSGIFFSPLYRNFVEPWAAVRDVPLWSAEVEHTLVLQPSR
jgi:penicillin G amidase